MRRSHARRRGVLLGALAAWMTLQSGCATLGVKPWERDQLAWPKMQMNSDATEGAIDDHIYFSKEASSGGRGFGGGGCGCN